MIMTYDLVIIGGGPAGAAAGVYAARKRIKSLLLVKEWGGQSVVSPDVQNWIGTVSLSGPEFAKILEDHVRAYTDDILDLEEDSVVAVENQKAGPGPAFAVTTAGGKTYKTKALLICSGSHRRKLEVPGAKKFDNKGISYCASCDAPLFKGKDVVVVGGGNAGFEAAQQLLAYATSLTLLERSDAFKADPITVDAVLKNPKAKALTNVELQEVKGDALVSGIVYKDSEGEHELPVGGVFVEIGALPNSDFIKGLVDLNKYGEIITDCKTQRTSAEGVWAAGDVSDVLFKQNNISAGDAVKALEDIFLFLHKK